MSRVNLDVFELTC